MLSKKELCSPCKRLQLVSAWSAWSAVWLGVTRCTAAATCSQLSSTTFTFLNASAFSLMSLPQSASQLAYCAGEQLFAFDGNEERTVSQGFCTPSLAPALLNDWVVTTSGALCWSFAPGLCCKSCKHLGTCAAAPRLLRYLCFSVGYCGILSSSTSREHCRSEPGGAESAVG